MRKSVIILIVAALIIFVYYLAAVPKISSPMILTSPSFNNKETIPQKFTCDGGNINPELQIQNVPEGAKSLALIMDDPDATGGRTFTHWLVWNIDPKTAVIKEESVPPMAVEGKNDFPKIGYGGPCPPRGSKPHRYFFKLYALNKMLDLKEGASKAELESEIQKYFLAQTELVGLFTRE